VERRPSRPRPDNFGHGVSPTSTRTGAIAMPVAPTHQWLSPNESIAAATAYTSAVGLDPGVEWQMQPGEQTALVALLAGLRPKVAIEIGSRYGGSMQVLHRFAD